MEITIQSLADIRQGARQFIENMGSAKVFCSMAKWAAARPLSSKLFVKSSSQRCNHIAYLAIVNEYTREPSGESIFHFDFYRIKKIEEVYDMGYEDYFDSGSLSFLEWPELIEDLLPEDAVKVIITENSNGSRTISF